MTKRFYLSMLLLALCAGALLVVCGSTLSQVFTLRMQPTLFFGL